MDLDWIVHEISDVQRQQLTEFDTVPTQLSRRYKNVLSLVTLANGYCILLCRHIYPKVSLSFRTDCSHWIRVRDSVPLRYRWRWIDSTVHSELQAVRAPPMMLRVNGDQMLIDLTLMVD